VLRRVLHAAGVLAGASIVVFVAGQVMPGDPAEVLLRQTTDAPAPEQVEGFRLTLKLDQELPRRYLAWVRSAASGDLGRSWRTGEPVARLVAECAGATATLALAAFAVVVLLGLGMGSLAVLSRGRWSETATRAAAIAVASVPSFWLGTILIELLGVRWASLPFVGRGGWSHHVLPALTLGLGVGVAQGRILRSVLRELSSQDFVRFAYAAGLTPRAVLLRRLLPNALPTVLTLWGMSLGQLLGGAFIVESIFSWPGLGRLTVDAVLGRDLPVLQGSILAVTLAFVVSTELVRVVQDWLDPRLARAGAATGGGAH
jgi:peptide/nickel transport system permease protein